MSQETTAGSSLESPGSVRFGLFDWIDLGQPDLGALYEQRLELLAQADGAGFYGYHLAEHHGTPLGGAPSPSLFLAAVAQRTRRIRLGPLVYLLSLYHPLRLWQEVCMLDQLSRGRLELGVGRGVSPYELALYNVDPGESRAVFREALTILLSGLASGEVTFEGRYFTVQQVSIPLRPVQKPYPPLWYPTSNLDSVPWLAAEGFNTAVGFLNPVLEASRHQLDLYRTHWEQNKDRPDRLNAHVARPLTALVRHVYIAESDEQAIHEARDAYARFFDNFNYLWAKHHNTYVQHLGDYDAGRETGMLLIGSPETVRARVEESIAASGCNYFLGVFAFGSLSTEQVLRSLRLFSEQVMPAVAQPAPADA